MGVIEVCKKNIDKEMKESLKIMERKNRMDVDYANALKAYKVEDEKLFHLTEELGSLQGMIETTKEDLQSVNAVG